MKQYVLGVARMKQNKLLCLDHQELLLSRSSTVHACIGYVTETERFSTRDHGIAIEPLLKLKLTVFARVYFISHW